MLALLLLGCGTSCEVDGPLDYFDDANWLCRPGVDRACPRTFATRTIAEDGQVTDGTFVATDDPGLACFLVYPTLDLGFGAGLHHRTDRVDGPERWSRIHGAPLQGLCDVYVPVYRQVRLGTYIVKSSAKQDQCFDNAYQDVEDAFDAFLAAEPTRPFVLLGHSQGGQHVSRLVDERIEDDPAVLARMVAAYPIGWPVGTDADGVTGGSFDTVPPCTSATQTSCVVGFRTFLKDRATPTAEDAFVEGAQPICVHPASPDAPGQVTRLASLQMDAESALLLEDVADPGTLVTWEGAFDARCAGEGWEAGLEVEWVRSESPPFDLDSFVVSKTNGSHQLDLALTLADIRNDITRRAGLP
jgi:hypothetical protein